MAQGAVVPVPTNGLSPTAEESREILEYERIAQFRDVVLAGTHPRVRIPPHLVGKQLNSVRNVSSPGLSKPRANNVPAQPARPTTSSFCEELPSIYNKTPNNQRVAAGAHLPMSAKSTKSEINPILLEKSDDLIKAEIQLQRQRLERALREQIDQQRLSQKALLQTSESLPNFDLSEVLTKALAIVHPHTTAEVEPSVGAHSSASDSFDENTFYSSQHDTPEPSSSSQGQKGPGEIQSHGVVSVDKRSAPIYSTQNQVGDQDVVMTGASLFNGNHLATQAHLQTQSSLLQSHPQVEFGRTLELGNSDMRSSPGGVMDDTSTNFRGLGSVSTHQNSSTESDKITSQQIVDRIHVQKATEDLLAQAFDNDTASPLIRAHNLSPIAPQPARVSPLATAREPPVLREAILVDEPPPTQVAALRNKPSGVSSTDSSPSKGTKGPGKKEKKKKKRKTKDNAGTPDSLCIKPEPRSPSPFAVAPLPRPQKRQRQSGQYDTELNYDEPRYNPEDDDRATERYKEVREPRVYERYDNRYDPELRRLEPVYQRLEHDDGEYQRVSGGQYTRRPQSPAVYAVPYTPSEVRPVRVASHAIVDRRIHEEPRYYRDTIPRASVRPDADRERSRSPVLREKRSPIPMAPPRQPVRIVVDACGREYIDSTPAPSMRQSMAPPTRYRDSDVVYERAPVRAVSGRAPVEAYEEDGVVYRRSSPPVTLPRRVITQPEYAPPEYRSYRQREYSVRPMAPPGEEYIQIRGAPEQRQMTQFEDTHRDYAPRAASLRPEAVRYEIPREYVRRLQSVRPEPPSGEYPASVHPEPRREVVQLPQPQREYSVRPVDTVPRREHVSVSEGERYYDEVSSRRPAEVAFIERPRAREASVLVFADDVRREVYR
jgi:hypothetical protein